MNIETVRTCLGQKDGGTRLIEGRDVPEILKLKMSNHSGCITTGKEEMNGFEKNMMLKNGLNRVLNQSSDQAKRCVVLHEFVEWMVSSTDVTILNERSMS